MLYFKMPYGMELQIKPSREINEEEIEMDEEVDDLVWQFWWDGDKLPYCTRTKAEAGAFALACQVGAYKMLEIMDKDKS